MHLHWNSGLDTGVVEIDAQHREIMELINSLKRLSVQRRRAPIMGEGMLAPLFRDDRATQSRILEAMDEFIDYTRRHFSFEEAVMEHAGHPATQEHCTSHQAFCTHVQDVREQFAAGEDVLEGFVRLLTNWLPKHIANDEAELTELVRDSSLKETASPEIRLSSGNMFEDILPEPEIRRP